ncbi:MAG: serine hydrolase domain-containing protein, partial [Bacteroidota bacterium]
MKMNIAFLVLSTACFFACSKDDDDGLMPSNENPTIEEIAAPYLAQSSTRAVSIALINGDQVDIRHLGSVSNENPTTPDDASIYEIGSVTKTFTARLLYDMAAVGLLTLDDPISNYLPDGVMNQMDATNAITLKDLATHTSGLPSIPDNILEGIDLNDPYS